MGVLLAGSESLMASWHNNDAYFRGYDEWRLSGPPESYDERSECEQNGCNKDEHEPGCPDYTEPQDEC